ncbi:MAG: hypothetical protein ACOCXP_02345 [Candidatus Dojkabacteria bacterium]
MARFIVAAQEDVDSRELGKLLTSKLRVSGAITLSLPPGMKDPQEQIDWVNMTGHDSSTGDYLIGIEIKEDGKKPGIVGWHSDDKGKSLAKSIGKRLDKEQALPLLTLQEHTQASEGSIALLEDTRPTAIHLEISNPKGIDLAKIAETIKKELLSEEGESTTYKSKKTATKLGTPTPKSGKSEQAKGTNAQSNSFNSSFDNNLGSDSSGGFAAGNSSFGEPTSGFGPSSGGFGASNGGFGGGSTGFGATSGGFGGGGAGTSNMSRDERKKMIETYYKKAFGKQPEQGDVNYFLNIGVSGEQLLKRILESEDHKVLVENAQKYDELKSEYDKLETESTKLKDQLNDQRKVLENLNSLLLQKNYALQQLNKRYRQMLEQKENNQSQVTSAKSELEYKGNFADRVFDFFSRLLS